MFKKDLIILRSGDTVTEFHVVSLTCSFGLALTICIRFLFCLYQLCVMQHLVESEYTNCMNIHAVASVCGSEIADKCQLHWQSHMP